jgi:protein-tyrosine kinase
MEKIKEALEKARGASPTVKRRVQAQVKSNVEETHEHEHEAHLDAINYDNTKIVELDPTHLEKNRIVAFNKNESSTLIFDSLRTQVLLKMQENNWRTLGIISPSPGSGKTFVAINLAISIANQPQKTAMLVDFDLRKPRVAKYLGLHTDKSLNDYLNGTAQIEDIMVNPGLPRLVVIPTMQRVLNPAETLSSSRVNGLIQDLKNRYDSRIVIFDLPPILNIDDALIMMPKIDCLLMVVGNGLVKETEIEEAMHHIPKEKLLGVVLNRAEVKTEAYYY